MGIIFDWKFQISAKMQYFKAKTVQPRLIEDNLKL